MAFHARVDPRPVRPPALGLVASANNVVVGADVQILENATVGDFNFNNAYTPGDPPPPNIARLPDGTPDIDAAAYASGFIRSEAADDYERPKIGERVRWISGFAYRPEVCDGGDIIAPLGTTVGTAPTLEDEIDVTPYVVEGVDQRSTFGAPGDDEYAEARGYARRQLLACESKQIEKELWTGKLTDGTLTGNRYLADNTANLVEGDRLLGYVTALAVLEQAINDGTCGQQGMIHARSDTVTLWVSEHLCHRQGNLIVTELGTIVVPGSGYDGSAPAAGDPRLDPAHAGKVPSTDSAWAYATTVVDVRRSAFIAPQPILERLDKTSNTLTTYERRFAAATWGCLHVGVHVDHINKISTTGS